MRFPLPSSLLVCVLAATSALGASESEAAFKKPDPKYKLKRTIPLEGETGWDYLAVDAAGRRIYVTRGTHVIVLDADSGEVNGIIPNTPGVHGVAFCQGLGRGYTSNGGDDSVTVFDLKTLAVIARVKTGANPDALICDESTNRVFVFNGRGQSATVVDAETEKAIGEIPMGGKPEFAAVDGKGRVFVNVEDKNEILVIDAATMKVTAHWPLAPGEEPTGLSIDVANGRLFAGCHSKHLVAVDSGSGKIAGTVPIGAGVDAVEFDASTSTVITSNGEGTLSVIRQESPSKYRLIENVPTKKGGRTMAFDGKTRHIFVIAADYGTAPAATTENPHPRAPIVAGSVALLEFAPE